MDVDYCRNPKCGIYIKPGRIKYCSGDCRNEALRVRLGTPEERHKNLVRILERERCPKTDPLWSLNYYEALLAFNGFRCQYCLGDLSVWSPTGHAMDRVVCFKNGRPVPHTAANCLGGGVCKDCNEVRGAVLSVTDMFALAPKLRELRHRKDVGRTFFDGKEVTTITIETKNPPVVVVGFQKEPDLRIFGPSAKKIIEETYVYTEHRKY
jgi:hypothetical protein